MNAAPARERQAVYALFFVSGVSALLYEIVWSKTMTLMFGSTVFAVSTVTAAFFAGLALGSWVFGRYVDRTKDPLRVYGALEIGIAVCALALPIVLETTTPLVDSIHRSYQTSFYALSLVRFVLVFLLLVVPTTLMGGTLPVLAKHFGRADKEVGRSIAKLYALNTLGALVGTIVAGYVLIQTVGVRRTTDIAVALNVLVVAGVFGLRRQAKIAHRHSSAPPPAEDAEPVDRTAQVIVLLAFGLSGCASLGYEILIFRALIYVLPFGFNNIYVFSSILGVFLAGIALGSAFIARRVDRLKDPLRFFCLVEIALGLYIGLTMNIIGTVVTRVDVFGAIRAATDAGRFFDGFLKCVVLLLPPTFLMGTTFPLVSRIVTKTPGSLGREIGRVYAANTLGSIFGSFFAGFVFVPFVGIHKSFLLVAMVSVGAAILGNYLATADKRRAKIVSAAAVVLLLLVFYVVPQRDLLGEDQVAKGQIVFSKEGISSTIVVLKDPGAETYSIQTNDFIAAGTHYYYLRNQRLMGYLPQLFAADPRRVLVICFGTGTTIGALTQLDATKHIDAVEIDADIFEGARFFARENHDAVNNPRVHKTVDDGRNFIRYTDARFDIITSEPLHPKRAGTVNLYSEDYYRLARAKMTDNGIIAQWIPLHAFQSDEFKSVVRAFKNVFPHTHAWLGQQMILLGSKEKLMLDWTRLRERMAQPAIHADLEAIDFEDPYDLAAGFLAAEADLDPYVAGAPTITDDLPTIEYSRDMRDTDLFAEIADRSKDMLPWFVHTEGLSEERFRERVERARKILRAKSAMVRGPKEKGRADFEELRKAYPGDRYIERLAADCIGEGPCAHGMGISPAR